MHDEGATKISRQCKEEHRLLITKASTIAKFSNARRSSVNKRRAPLALGRVTGVL